jgi:hypothetical protein
MRKLFLPALLVSLGFASWTLAWWVKGHGTITEAAASRLPEGVPQFFRSAGKQLAHLSGDPDRWKNKGARHLNAAEAPNHYVDLEDFGDNELPADRYKAGALLMNLKQRPERTGMLPYAIMEDFDRLSVAFYDYRADADNEAIRMKCIVYAGNLAHFTGDAAMPLHTTRNYDGKPGPGGDLVQKGIHPKIDGFPEKFGLTAEEIGRGLEPTKIDDMWGYVMKQIRESHKHIDRCYELDVAGAFDKPTAESRAFILERCRTAAQFTLDVWYTAWLRSADMQGPHY